MSFQPFPLAAPPPTQQKSNFGPDLSVRLICPECRDPNPNIVEEFGSGDLVCGNCGLVLGDRIVDTRSEWRTFANDEGDDPSRVGAAMDPLLDGIEQLDTVISFRDGGSGIARELQRAASRSQSSRSERNLMQAFRDISAVQALGRGEIVAREELGCSHCRLYLHRMSSGSRTAHVP